MTGSVPDLVRQLLRGDRFIERVSFLFARGEVMLDSVSYVALDGLDAGLKADLLAGLRPIGHLLTSLWTRREPIAEAASLAAPIWTAVGLPDDAATRAYRIVAPDGPRMIVVETYRRGMLMKRRE